jgi:hypothetical protein
VREIKNSNLKQKTCIKGHKWLCKLKKSKEKKEEDQIDIADKLVDS